MNFYQSLRSITAAATHDRGFSYAVVAKETPSDPGRFERRMQDIVEPVIPGPSRHREPLVEIAAPYHIEAHGENTSDTMERPSQQAAPHSPLGLSGSETYASVALQPSARAIQQLLQQQRCVPKTFSALCSG